MTNCSVALEATPASICSVVSYTCLWWSRSCCHATGARIDAHPEHLLLLRSQTLSVWNTSPRCCAIRWSYNMVRWLQLGRWRSDSWSRISVHYRAQRKWSVRGGTTSVYQHRLPFIWIPCTPQHQVLAFSMPDLRLYAIETTGIRLPQQTAQSGVPLVVCSVQVDSTTISVGNFNGA